MSDIETREEKKRESGGGERERQRERERERESILEGKMGELEALFCRDDETHTVSTRCRPAMCTSLFTM